MSLYHFKALPNLSLFWTTTYFSSQCNIQTVFSTAFILSALQHQSSTTNPVIHWLKETESLLPSVKTSLTPFILSTNIPKHSSYSSVLSRTKIKNSIRIIKTSSKIQNIKTKPIKKLNSTNGMRFKKNPTNWRTKV